MSTEMIPTFNFIRSDLVDVERDNPSLVRIEWKGAQGFMDGNYRPTNCKQDASAMDWFDFQNWAYDHKDELASGEVKLLGFEEWTPPTRNQILGELLRHPQCQERSLEWVIALLDAALAQIPNICKSNDTGYVAQLIIDNYNEI